MKKAIDISTSPYTKLCRLISSLLLLSWVGCSNEDLPDPSVPGSNKEPVVLIFNASPALMTRTVLTSPDNLQHVRQVQLYIFDGATDNARCVASENINWQYATGAENGLSTKEQTYKVVYEGFQASKVYTFLAIGLDDTSGATYGLPNAIQANPTSGTLLKDANALLAAGKGRTDIAGSELFAGFSQLTTNILNGGTEHVDLYRRVAGVIGYFKNIPTQIGGVDVSALHIELYTIQNKSVPLIKRDSNDYIMGPMSSDPNDKIIVNIPKSAFVTGGTTIKGSYILPIPAPVPTDKDYTLQVVLVDASGTPLYTHKVRLSPDGEVSETNGGTGIIVPTNDPYRFPILTNHFYSIGTQASPIDLNSIH